jgi:hypothetical protein
VESCGTISSHIAAFIIKSCCSVLKYFDMSDDERRGKPCCYMITILFRDIHSVLIVLASFRDIYHNQQFSQAGLHFVLFMPLVTAWEFTGFVGLPQSMDEPLPDIVKATFDVVYSEALKSWPRLVMFHVFPRVV